MASSRLRAFPIGGRPPGRPPGRSARNLGVAMLLALSGALLVRPEAVLAEQAPGSPGERITGQVTEADGQPVRGALVAVEDTEGRRIRATLSDVEGRFALTLPHPGRFLLRVERLGYRALATDPFDVLRGETVRHDVQVTGEPILVDHFNVVVDASDRCVRDPERGALLAELWEQARQAFRRVEVTEEEAHYRFGLRRYERLVEIPTAQVVEERWLDAGASLRSFRSPPAETLLAEGWIRAEPDGDFTYFGPDLAVLLSREFEDAHCLRLAEADSRPSRIGVAFEPVRSDGPPGIRGTLWMDRESLALEAFTFHYTRHLHDPEIPGSLLELFGGEIDFRTLPDGRAVVDRWTLRMPDFRLGSRPTQWRIPSDPDGEARQLQIRRAVERAPRLWQEAVLERRLLFWEEGGDLTRIQTPTGEILPGREEAVVAGVVQDSLRRPPGPLPGATVRLEGTEVEATTNAQGRFRLAVPMEGSYRLGFGHPRLDSLGVPAPEPVPVTLTTGLVTEVRLAVPSRATLLAQACTDVPAGEASGILVGRVLDEALREPVPLARVTLHPDPETDPQGGGDPGPAGLTPVTTRADAEGAFRFCDVPAGFRFRLVAETEGLDGPARRLIIPAPGRTLEVDALLDQGNRSRIAGRVTEGERGDAVPGAEVRLEGPERHSITADARGRFEIPGVAPGAYRVHVEHLGYRAVETGLEVPRGGHDVEATLRLLPDAIALDPIEVTVEARVPRLNRVGFYDRERSGFGTYLTREEIERRNPMALASLFNVIPRATIHDDGLVMFRGAETLGGVLDLGPPCFARVHVDGRFMGENFSLHAIDPGQVEAMEVYAGPAQIPIEFSSSDAACGVIMIWLRDGG